MLIRPKASNVNALSPLEFWLLVGASCVALIAMVATFTTRTVQADAQLLRPAATASPAAASATPDLAQSGPATRKHGKIFRGLASWYGAVFNGRHTASGERFDMYAMTACHPTLPFGSKVRVVNLANKRSVVVRITDRGDLNAGRVIDVSYGAAEKLEMTKAGVVNVQLEVLSLGGSGHNN